MNKYGCALATPDVRDRYYHFISQQYSSRYFRTVTKVYNQGDKPWSVGYAIASYIADREAGKDLIVEDFDIETFVSHCYTNSKDAVQIRRALDRLKHDGIQDTSGKVWKCTGYGRLHAGDLKEAIVDNGPILIVLPVYDGTVTDFWVPRNLSTLLGHQCAVINGFDNDKYLLKNSWGRDWGSNGHCIITYGEILQYAPELWLIN